VQARDGRVGDPGDDVGEPSLRIDVVELCGADQFLYWFLPSQSLAKARMFSAASMQ
jgi:hypothetical protein